VLILGYIVLNLSWPNSDFDIKIKEIENILNSSESRKRKYELFDMLDIAAKSCNNYDELAKLQELLNKVYEL
jgi:hypothetical protein